MARDLVMVNGLPGSGKSTLGPRLANALGAAFVSKDRVKDALAEAEPLALGPVLRVDTTQAVDLPALCTQVKAALWAGIADE